MPSTVIRHFSYDAPRRVLHVTFQSGLRYDYFDVPMDIADAMHRAFSKGEYFNEFVRPYYRFQRLAA